MQEVFDYILNTSDMRFILENIDDDDLKSLFSSFREVNQTYLLSLSKEQVVKLLDSLADVLVAKGLNRDEPNDLGLKIESLIDTFNSKLW